MHRSVEPLARAGVARDLASRARRLALTMWQESEKARLNAYAAELDQEADQLEAKARPADGVAPKSN